MGSPVGLVPEGWCLAEEGRRWLIYSPAGDQIRLSRALNASGAEATWFNPRSGETQPAHLDGATAMTKPTAEAWLLWIVAS